MSASYGDGISVGVPGSGGGPNTVEDSHGSGDGLQSVVSAARVADGVQPQVHVLAIVFVTSASVAKLRIIRQRLAHKVAFRVYLNRQDAKGRRIFRLLTEEECTQAASCV